MPIVAVNRRKVQVLLKECDYEKCLRYRVGPSLECTWLA